MTTPAFLRRLEPALFGATPQRSWDLRDRIRAYTLLGSPGFLSPQTGSRPGVPSSADQPTLGPEKVALLATQTDAA